MFTSMRMLVAGLALSLVSCVYLQPVPVRTDPPPPPSPSGPTVLSGSIPAPGQYTYNCEGGRLVVSYLSDGSVRIFYDDSFRLLRPSVLNRGVFSDGGYVWDIRGTWAELTLGGRSLSRNCRVS